MTSTALPGEAPGRLRILTWLATAATTVTAAWLVDVSLTVLPDRDPTHVGFWLAVAGSLLAFAALTALHLVRWGGPIVRWLAGGVALLATVAGAWLAVSTLAGSGDFEGYLVLIGLVVVAHGALVVLSTLRG
jgi:hypothetical protein